MKRVPLNSLAILGILGSMAPILSEPMRYEDNRPRKDTPKFSLRTKSTGPDTDSTPLTKREKRKLRRAKNARG